MASTYRNLFDTVYHQLGFVSASELVNDNDLIIHYNNSVGLIESEHDWSFMNTTKTITPEAPGTTFTLPTELYKVFSARGYTDAEDTTGVPLIAVNKIPEISPECRFDVTTAKTFDTYERITIFGNWGLARISSENVDANETIPLPQILLSAVYNYIMFYVVPIYVDTGFELAGFYEKFGKKNAEQAVRKYATMTGATAISLKNSK